MLWKCPPFSVVPLEFNLMSTKARPSVLYPRIKSGYAYMCRPLAKGFLQMTWPLPSAKVRMLSRDEDSWVKKKLIWTLRLLVSLQLMLEGVELIKMFWDSSSWLFCFGIHIRKLVAATTSFYPYHSNWATKKSIRQESCLSVLFTAPVKTLVKKNFVKLVPRANVYCCNNSVKASFGT